MLTIPMHSRAGLSIEPLQHPPWILLWIPVESLDFSMGCHGGSTRDLCTQWRSSKLLSERFPRILDSWGAWRLWCIEIDISLMGLLWDLKETSRVPQYFPKGRKVATGPMYLMEGFDLHPSRFPVRSFLRSHKGCILVLCIQWTPSKLPWPEP